MVPDLPILLLIQTTTLEPLLPRDQTRTLQQRQVTMSVPLPFFPGLSPAGVLSNKPDFSSILFATTSSAALVPTMGMDLTGGRNLADLSPAMVLTNILSKLKISGRVYTVIKVVGPCLILAAGAFEFGRNLSFIPTTLGAIGSKLASYVTASIVVPVETSLNADVCAYVAAQGAGISSKSLTLSPPQGQDFWDMEKDPQREIPVQPLHFIPSFGASVFRWKHYHFTMERTAPTAVEDRNGAYHKVDAKDLDPTIPQNITLSCFPTFNGTQPIKDFLDHVRGFATPSRDDVTNVFFPDRNGTYFFWERVSRPARALEGVVMESKIKDSLVADLDFYLSAECRKFYENRGIPYRRGYLLYGPPGTGKTSFATAIASHFKLPVYILNLADLNDKSLELLFGKLPRRCCLMMEDCDSAGLDREYTEVDESAGNNDDSEENLNPTKKKVKSVTLSGLLNALDGPASVDGRVLFMTSNSPDSLDAALIRPGRCDRKILFGYVCPEVSAKFFTNIYTRTANELYKGETNAADTHDIPAMAEQFAAKIPVGAAITPAECQAWLLSNRLDPVAALEGADQWASEIIENKLRGANVASFANEVKRIPKLRRESCDGPPTPSYSDDEEDDD